MNVGDLRHVVAFDEPIEGEQPPSGGESITMTYAFSMRAEIEPLTGREQLLGEQLNAQLDTRIRIRYSPRSARINAKWRCRHRNVTYSIVAPPVNVKMANREIELLCQSGVIAD